MGDLIYVILVNFNSCDDTLECINSILNSKIDGFTLKILVVDNDSSDESVDKLSEINEIELLSLKVNGGFTGGNNAGIEYALSKGATHVLILNNDTVVNESCITELYRACNTNEICLPKMFYYFDKELIWYAGGSIDRLTAKVIHYGFNCKDSKEFSEEKEVSFATGCCMLLTNDVLKIIKGFNDKFFLYCEDMELSLRAIENGIKIRYIPSAKLYHKISRSTGGGRSKLSIYYNSRNRLYAVYLHKQYFSKFTMIYIYFALIIKYLRGIIGNKNWLIIKKAILEYRLLRTID